MEYTENEHSVQENPEQTPEKKPEKKKKKSSRKTKSQEKTEAKKQPEDNPEKQNVPQQQPEEKPKAKQETKAEGTEQPKEQQGEEKVVLIVDLEEQKIEALKNPNNEKVPFNEQNQSDFLKVDKNSILENFFSNYARQYDNPKRFKLLEVPGKLLDSAFKLLDKVFKAEPPENVLKFVTDHEVQPDRLKTALKDTDQRPAENVGEKEGKTYQYIDERMVNWKELESKLNISRDYLEKKGFLNDLLQGNKTEGTVPIKIDLGYAQLQGQARLQFRKNEYGLPKLNLMGVKKEPDFRTYYGHVFSPQDIKNLKETNHMQRAVFLNGREGEKVKAVIGLDPYTNDIIATRVNNVQIPKQMCGVELSDYEQEKLREGKAVRVEGMISPKTGKEFSATLQIDPDKHKVTMKFDSPDLFERKTLGGKRLTDEQLTDLKAGKAVLVENMKSRADEPFSRYVKINETTKQPEFFKYNPDSPAENREIIIPKVISGVELNADQYKQLANGEPVWIEGMRKTNGEEMDRYVKLNLDNGDVRYATKIENFEKSFEQVTERKYDVPPKLLGHKFKASELSALRNGDSVFIKGFDGYDGKKFDSWLKANPDTGRIAFHRENPDQPNAKQLKQVDNKQDQKNEHSRGQGVR